MNNFLSPEEYRVLTDNQYKLTMVDREIDEYKDRIKYARNMNTVTKLADELYDYVIDENVKEAIDQCHDKMDAIQMIEALL